MKHCTTDKCPQILDSSCVFYEGPTLLFSGINTNDSVETVIQKLNLKLESIPVFNSNNYYNKTDINNIIKGYIPLSGTLPNYPIVGNIEFSPGDNVKLYSNDSFIMIDNENINVNGKYITISSINNNSILINNTQVFLNSGTTNDRKFINLSQEFNYIPLQSNFDGPGLVGVNYYGNNYVDNSFVQKKFVTDTFNNVDLSNFYTKNETDLLLENYYLKSETYSKTEIDNSLDDKLDKGTYTGTASDLFLNYENLTQSLQNEQSARYYAYQGLENSKQNKLESVSGNTGVGKTDASATEKLDIAGRSKSDGQVFNETTSAILPKEIKFKDGKFKAALADGVEKSVLLDGDVSGGVNYESLNKLLFHENFGWQKPNWGNNTYQSFSIGTTIAQFGHTNEGGGAGSIKGFGITYKSATTSIAYMRGSSAAFVLNANATATRRFSIDTTVSTQRLYIGFSDRYRTANPTNVQLNSLIGFIAICMESGNSNLLLMHNDNSDTATVIDTGFTNATKYYLIRRKNKIKPKKS